MSRYKVDPCRVRRPRVRVQNHTRQVFPNSHGTCPSLWCAVPKLHADTAVFSIRSFGASPSRSPQQTSAPPDVFEQVFGEASDSQEPAAVEARMSYGCVV